MRKFILIPFLFVALSCKKDENVQPTVSFLLSNNDVKSWITTSATINGEEQESCYSDDIFEFTLDHKKSGRDKRTYILRSGLVRCNVTTDISSSGFCFLSNDEKFLYLTSTGSYSNITYKYKIISITENTLHIRRINYEDDQIKYGLSSPVIEFKYESQ